MNTGPRGSNLHPPAQRDSQAQRGRLRNAGAAIAAMVVAGLAVFLVAGVGEVAGRAAEQATGLVLVSAEFCTLVAAFWGALIGVPAAVVGAFTGRWWYGPAGGLAVALLLTVPMLTYGPGVNAVRCSGVALFLVAVAAASVLGSLAGRWIRKASGQSVQTSQNPNITS